MKSLEKRTGCKKSPPAWHDGFMAMMPAITKQARVAFRHLRAEAREEMIQEVICNACCAYSRLVELNRTDLAFASVLARFGIAQARGGRKVGGSLNKNDVSSGYCQCAQLILERLDNFDTEEQAWQEVLVEDQRTGPAEVAASRIDFSAWLCSLPRRLRRIATFLANGETTTAAAKRFRVSQGRISQIRRELFQAWRGSRATNRRGRA